MASWRLIKNGVIVAASGLEGSEPLVENLTDRSIVSVSIQSQVCRVDPVLFFDDGQALELFSDDTLEPWVLRLPSGEVFVPNPSERDLIG